MAVGASDGAAVHGGLEARIGACGAGTADDYTTKPAQLRHREKVWRNPSCAGLVGLKQSLAVVVTGCAFVEQEGELPQKQLEVVGVAGSPDGVSDQLDPEPGQGLVIEARSARRCRTARPGHRRRSALRNLHRAPTRPRRRPRCRTVRACSPRGARLRRGRHRLGPPLPIVHRGRPPSGAARRPMVSVARMRSSLRALPNRPRHTLDLQRPNPTRQRGPRLRQTQPLETPRLPNLARPHRTLAHLPTRRHRNRTTNGRLAKVVWLCHHEPTMLV